MAKRRRSSGSTASQRFAGILAVILALVLGIAALAGLQTNVVQPSVTPTLNPLTPTVYPFPTVPAGGTAIIIDHTYLQSTGLLTIPHIQGWDVPTSNGEETVGPATPLKVSGSQATPDNSLARVATTFINNSTLSVIHVFAERDPSRKAKVLGDLDAYY